MVILAAAPAICVLMLLLMLAIFSRVYLAHSFSHSLKAHASARRKKLFLAAAESVKYLHKNDSPAHSPADIAHNKVEILMVCVTSNARLHLHQAAKEGKNDENFAQRALWRAASISAAFVR